MRLTRIIPAALVATVLGVAAFAAPAGAWPSPRTDVKGAACQSDGTRNPIVWTVTNLETGYPDSPAKIVEAHVTPAFGVSKFDKATLPNTGDVTAHAKTEVPSDYVGPVTLKYRMVWSGPYASDERAGSVTVHVLQCCKPTTTTTTTPPTTAPPVTRQVPTTTTTTVPSTTTTVRSTSTTTSTTTTVAPTTTTTTPVVVEVKAAKVVEVVPVPVAPAPAPVAVAPHFTG